jgi:hypothetical protein
MTRFGAIAILLAISELRIPMTYRRSVLLKLETPAPITWSCRVVIATTSP